jgi:hypothetical protein
MLEGLLDQLAHPAMQFPDCNRFHVSQCVTVQARLPMPCRVSLAGVSDRLELGVAMGSCKPDQAMVDPFPQSLTHHGEGAVFLHLARRLC